MDDGRFDELNFVRAVAIVAVVLCHALAAYMPGTSAPMSMPVVIALGLNQACRFAVPSFLFASGVLAIRSYDRVGFDQFIARKTVTIALPYIAWTMIALLSAMNLDFNYVWLAVLFGKGRFSQLYYLSVLLQLFAIMPLWSMLARKARGVVLVGFVSLCLVAASEYVVMSDSLSAPTLAYLDLLIGSTFPGWAIFFVAGCFAGRKYLSFRTWLSTVSYQTLILLLCASVVLLIADMYLIHDSIYVNLLIRPAIFLYASCVMLCLLKKGMALKSKLIIDIDNNSFGIFLIHIAILVCIKKITEGLLFANLPLTLLAFIITFAISYAATVAIQKTPLKTLLLGAR